MSETDLFYKNIELLKKKIGKEAIPVISMLNDLSSQPWSFCNTGTFQQINLKRTSQNKEYFLHSPENIEAEASQWFNEIDVASKDVIVVYGLGLGYYYQTAKEWLHAKSSRKLIFIEDDLFILHRFLEMETSTELLMDPQVDIYAYHVKFSSKQEVINLVEDLLFRRTEITALKEYARRKADVLNFIQFQCQFLKQWREIENVEYLDSGRAFYSNFFRNASKMPLSYNVTGMRNYFKGIPAIICGAGPSLKKHLDVLNGLKDKALIFGGGSTMNVLNGNGITPHFGIGLDPFPTQFARLVTNTAFEVPFFYTNRMNSQAFEIIHGPKLFVSNSGAYSVGPWLDEKLKLKSDFIDAGANVINFSVSLAEFLGCNPIILIGVDLAYTEGASYAPGIATHAIHTSAETLITKNEYEEVVQKNDIYGKPVYTLWKWISESYWFTFFAASHPETTIINSTEGGIGFQKIENIPLAEVTEKYLTKSKDIQGMVNATIQQNPMPESVNVQNIRDAIEVIRLSLLDILKLLEKNQSIQDPPDYFEKQLTSQEGYKAVLENLDERLKDFAKIISSAAEENGDSPYEFPTRIQFLNETIQHILRYIKLAQALLITEELRPPIKHKIDPHLPKEMPTFDGKTFTIEDEELDLHIKETVETNLIKEDSPQPWNGKLITYTPENKLLMEQYYKNGKLHGPSTGYGKNQLETSKTWFVNGLKQGTSIYHYGNGQVYSIERYKNGEKEGYQVYYYPDGNLKSTIPFKNGKLDGLVRLFYPNGIPMREIFYTENKRNGKDILLTPSGAKWIQAEYVLDVPVGAAREWHENGILTKEISYGPDGEKISERKWTAYGEELPQFEIKKEDYFEKFTREAEMLTKSIEGVLTKVNELSELFKGAEFEEKEKKEFEELREQLVKLSEANAMMVALAKGTDKENQELIWKSPLAREAMQKQASLLTNKLRLAFTKMQSYVHHLKEHFKQPGPPTDDS